MCNEQSFTVSEIAKYFNVSRQAVHDWTNRGELKADKHPVTGYKSIRVSCLKEFAQNRRLDISGLLRSEDNEGRVSPCMVA